MSRHTDATLALLQYSNSGFRSNPELITELLGNHSVLDPPDPIPNSEVKRNSADDSVGSPHVKVGHCQAFNFKTPYLKVRGFEVKCLAMTYFHMGRPHTIIGAIPFHF